MLLLDPLRTLPTDHKWESILTVVVQVSCSIKSAVNNSEAQQSESNRCNLLDLFHLLRYNYPEKTGDIIKLSLILSTYILNWSSTIQDDGY